MSSVSKLDYLQKYLSNDDLNKKQGIKKKKKKVKRIKNKANFKIIDNDISLSNIQQPESDEYEFEEEKPLVFAEGGSLLQDELNRQEELKKLKWKSMNAKETNKEHSNGDKMSQKLSRVHHNSSCDDDISPPRHSASRRNAHHDSTDSDLSPVGFRKKSSADSDVSPPRKKRERHDSDVSPPRRRNQNSDSDVSPPRRRKHDSDSDVSPPRRKKQNSDSDISPPRRRKHDSDSDVSPPRKNKSIHKSRKEEHPEIIKKSGLRTGSELREENILRKKREKELFDSMEQSISGRGAETIHRDRKTGKKIDLKFEELKKRHDEEQKLEKLEQYRKWGKGLAQVKSHQEKIDEDLKEMAKPLARYKDDRDLDDMLRKQDRDGDPMLAYMSKKKSNPTNKPSKPRYNGPTPPPNRFNIWPGYRYDGVDRSNGFEKKRYLAISRHKSLKNEAFKWSTEDM